MTRWYKRQWLILRCQFWLGPTLNSIIYGQVPMFPGGPTFFAGNLFKRMDADGESDAVTRRLHVVLLHGTSKSLEKASQSELVRQLKGHR